MPRFDGTGPQGQGPMTGRGAGKCGGGRTANGSATSPGRMRGQGNAGRMAGTGRRGISGLFGRIFGSQRASGGRRY